MKNLKRHILIGSVLLGVLLIFSISSYSKQYHWKCMIPSTGSWEESQLYLLADEIKLETDGQVTIDVYIPGEHPYKLADTLKAVSTGEAEICGIIPGYVSGIEPGLTVLDLPLLIPNGDFTIYQNLFHEFKDTYFKEIFDKWNSKEIISTLMSGQNYYLKDGWIENSESLKGKKIRTWSAEVTNFIKLMNGIPVTLAFDENYTALQTGLLDGTTTNFWLLTKANLFDVCKNAVMAQVSFSSIIYLVNVEAWNSLPQNLQSTLNEIFESKRELWETANYKEAGAILQLAFLTHGINAKGIPMSYRQELREGAYEAIWKPWIENAGEAGEEAFNVVVEIIEKLGHDIPLPIN